MQLGGRCTQKVEEEVSLASPLMRSSLLFQQVGILNFSVYPSHGTLYLHQSDNRVVLRPPVSSYEGYFGTLEWLVFPFLKGVV